MTLSGTLFLSRDEAKVRAARFDSDPHNGRSDACDLQPAKMFSAGVAGPLCAPGLVRAARVRSVDVLCLRIARVHCMLDGVRCMVHAGRFTSQVRCDECILAFLSHLAHSHLALSHLALSRFAGSVR